MKKFFPLEAIEAEGIKYALGKARLNEIYRERVHGAKAAQQNANFMPSARAAPCKLRVLRLKTNKICLKIARKHKFN